MPPSSPTPQQGPGNSLGSSQPTQQPSLDVLLIIFIHGYSVQTIHPPERLLIAITHSPSSFKGDDTTFRDFPLRLQHILSETVHGTVIESIVFPVYEVRLLNLFRIYLTQRCSRPGAISYVFCHVPTTCHNCSGAEQSRRTLCRLADYPNRAKRSCSWNRWRRWSCQDCSLWPQVCRFSHSDLLG